MIKSISKKSTERVVNSSLEVFTNKYKNKTLELFGRFFVSPYAFAFILLSFSILSFTLPIQAYAESTPIVSTVATPVVSAISAPRTLKLTIPRIKGDDVKTLQTFLNNSGYNCGTADGIFGPKTEAQVKLFQIANNLIPDGKAGKNTLAIISQSSTSNSTNNQTSTSGCTSSLGFSTTTGKSCANTSIVSTLGCTSGALFNTTTGASCGTLSVLPAGCSSSLGFSTTLGVSCSTGLSATQTFLSVVSGWHSGPSIHTVSPTISGVTAPVAGATPVGTLADGTGYTATISWSPVIANFAPATVYTATVTLTPKTGYTLTGVTANFFTVSGATATNPINSGVVTAFFPATQAYASTPSSITLAVGSTAPVGGVTNVAIPSAGATDTTGAIRGWITGTHDNIKFTVTDGTGASTITIGGSPYTSGANYVVPSTSSLSIVVTTTESGKTSASRTFTISVTANVAVGDLSQGGRVAYVLVNGDPGYNAGTQHGIIASLADLSTSKYWHATNDGTTGTTGTAIGTGLGNTNTIVATYGAESNAARLTYDYTNSDTGTGIYTDWYLPSKDELNKLYLNRVLVGGFIIGSYWSSSEYDLTTAWSQDFLFGSQGYYSKSYAAYVRAVRAF